MRRTSWTALALALVVALAVSYLVLVALYEGAGVLVSVPWYSAPALVVVAAAVWWQGRAVRDMVAGRETTMTPLAAARVLAMAKACSYGGAAVLGYFAAHALLAARDLHADYAVGQLWSVLANVLAAVLVLVVGLVVERWCEIPPGDDGAPGGPGAQRERGEEDPEPA